MESSTAPEAVSLNTSQRRKEEKYVNDRITNIFFFPLVMDSRQL